ncbi:MAG: hypothetical protein ABIB46_02520 [bacterium]
MKKKYEQLKADVLDEIEEIEQVLKNLSFLKNNLIPKKIDNVQKAAIGTFLMNFYVGIENIIKRITKEYYQSIPKGKQLAQRTSRFILYATTRKNSYFQSKYCK